MIPYTLIRSSRRTVSLEISREGTITVRAPLTMPAADIEAFVASRQGWIERHLATLSPPRPEPAAEAIEALRTAAKAYLPARVEHYAAIMGLTPASVKITSAKRRFGSCSGRNGLCFSLYLMQYPPEAIDYVVVHELAHIRHKNHSAAFHALVAKYLPDHKARRAMLKGAGRNQDEAGNS